MKGCPVCNSDDLHLWGVKNGYSLHLCKSCTHIFADTESKIEGSLNELPEEHFRAIITNNMMKNDADYYHHLKAGEQDGLHTNITFRNIKNELRNLNYNLSGSWLDIGSGSGYLVDQVSKLGWEAVGIEPGGWGQIAAVDKKINIIQGFLSKDTFSKKFDVISATDVLEHQSTPYEFVDVIKHYVKPDGFIIFSIPFADSLFAKFWKTKWSMVAPPTHCQFFNAKSLGLFATKAGLSIIKIQQYNSTRFRFFSRFDFLDRLINKVLAMKGWGDQAVVVMRPSN
jgi:2-polyprenyl-3-methyl-5-hydroxy-6-metoxy-1,4-benzoquinol methylase